MPYMNPCTILWNQQATLFEQIQQLKLLIAYTERQINHHQKILDTKESKRAERRKAKWAVSTNRRYLEDLDSRLRALLQSLANCQNQISQIQFMTPWMFAQPQMPCDYGWFQAYEMSANFSSSNHSPDPGSGKQASSEIEAMESDSTAEPTDHIYSHESKSPVERPKATRPRITSTDSTTELVATAEEFIPSTPTMIYSPQAPRIQINPGLFFTQPFWSPNSASCYSSKDTAFTISPVSPVTRETEGTGKGNRRYSIAAIELIESRLKKKSEVYKAVVKSKRKSMVVRVQEEKRQELEQDERYAREEAQETEAESQVCDGNGVGVQHS